MNAALEEYGTSVHHLLRHVRQCLRGQLGLKTVLAAPRSCCSTVQTWRLYHGAAPRVGPEPRGRFAGHYNAFEIVQLWNYEAPRGRVLVGDSFFGSHDAAAML